MKLSWYSRESHYLCGEILIADIDRFLLEKLWRAPDLRRRGALFLSKADDVLFPQDSRIQLFIMLKVRILVGILVQGTSARRVRIHAYKRVRNGKTEFVKAHWRQYWR